MPRNLQKFFRVAFRKLDADAQEVQRESQQMPFLGGRGVDLMRALEVVDAAAQLCFDLLNRQNSEELRKAIERIEELERRLEGNEAERTRLQSDREYALLTAQSYWNSFKRTELELVQLKSVVSTYLIGTCHTEAANGHWTTAARKIPGKP